MRVRSRNVVERRAAEHIARAIELDIITRDLRPGTLVGSEATLMERYGASRGVIREAVCLVENHMMAETRRGIGGGLVVTEPDSSVVSEVVSLHLARQKVSEADLLEARLSLELLALRRTIESLDEGGVKLLQVEMDHVLAPDEDVAAASQRFHNLLADLSGNGVLRMFVPMMTGLVEEMWTAPGVGTSLSSRRRTWNRVRTTHNHIIEAILERDLDEASARLAAHLDDVTGKLRARARRVRVRG